MTFGYISPKKYQLRAEKRWRRIAKLVVEKYSKDQPRDDHRKSVIPRHRPLKYRTNKF
jgi:hypothetical protein